MFKKRLRELRKESKLTQEELAKILDITPSAIGMYEQGRREPDYGILVAIANYFEVTIDYLVGKTDEKLYVPDKNIKRIPFKDIPELAHIEGYVDIIKEVAERGLSPSDLKSLLDWVDKASKKNNT